MTLPFTPELKHKDVEILQEKIVYSGYCPIKEYQLRFRLFAGGFSPSVTRELILRPEAAAVLLYDPETDEVVLIEQFRLGAYYDQDSPWILDVVAGLVDSEESPIEAARRETLEEAGCNIISMIHICDYLASVGISDEKTSVFCGIIDIPKENHKCFGLAEHAEDIKIHIFKLSEAIQLLQAGKIKPAAAIIALQWLALNHSIVKNLPKTPK